MKPKVLVLTGFALLLVLAGTLQAVRYKPSAGAGKGKHLEQVLALDLSGWNGRNTPLGPTEASEGEVEKILNFDDVFLREYASAKGTLSLYVAYWGPGKIQTQVAASHTPDRCWSSAGWVCEAQRHAVVLPGLKPGEWRIFSADRTPDLKVIYWLLVGENVYDFGDRFNRVPSPWRWWRDVAKQIFSAPTEQYFIRLTSDRPFEELNEDPGFQELLASLARLGLAAH